MLNKKNVSITSIIYAIIAITILSIFWIAIIKNTPSVITIQDKPAPNFVFNTIEKQEISLENSKTKPIFIYFWASWCANCIEEMLIIEKQWRLYKNLDYIFLGVNIFDTKKDSINFINKNGITFPISNDNNNNSAIEFGLIGIPEAFFISKDSKIKNKIIGPFNENALKIALEQIRF
ncbi:MAG: TlpA disulfide reductase family protein [Dehalococcoidia bacterium]|jgi:peroxiredoxin|nr:MAG: cytochrome c biogenesis protein CcmG, thiol:disulfide interchange protein DsbE [Chloroflexota bacterium]|tara:strand:+ start:3819 stop:4349 length:531 start_codon:yes stop_codon:yes gene_type:complete